MNFRRFFENDKAVSPVIGVVLMVAITVILAAAIGSSVFGEGTSEPAPQAHLNMKAVSPYTSSADAVVTIEHLGGDPINFSSNSTTKVMATIGTTATEVNATGLAVMDVGDTDSLYLNDTGGDAISDAIAGTTVNFKIIDVATKQLIVDKDVRF